MKSIYILLSTLLFCMVAVSQPVQKRMPDACLLISDSTINALLGTVVKLQQSTVPGKHCPHRSNDNATEIVVQYTDFGDASMAATMLKANADGNKTEIANKGMSAGAFTTLEMFEPAGDGANYMTGKDEIYGPLVRLQFVLGNYLITLDTRGVPVETVKTNLAEMYSAIKRNSGL